MSSIPYDPSLILGNIVDPARITVLEEISSLQAQVRPIRNAHAAVCTSVDDEPLAWLPSFHRCYTSHGTPASCPGRRARAAGAPSQTDIAVHCVVIIAWSLQRPPLPSRPHRTQTPLCADPVSKW